jgi:hypothetical protein
MHGLQKLGGGNDKSWPYPFLHEHPESEVIAYKLLQEEHVAEEKQVLHWKLQGLQDPDELKYPS